MKKFLIKWAFKIYYMPWCKLYRWFQKNSIGYPGKRDEVMDKVGKIIVKPGTPHFHWEKIVKEFDLNWKKDKWYQLFDAISNPFISAYNHGDDCDGYAAMALEFLRGEYIADDKFYKKKGFVSLINNDLLGGHTLGVWEARDKSIIVNSNSDIHSFDSEEAMVRWWNQVKSSKSPSKFIVEYTKDLKFKEVRECDI